MGRLSRWMELAVDLSVKAVRTIAVEEHGRKDIDIKRFVRLEKIPGTRVTVALQ